MGCWNWLMLIQDQGGQDLLNKWLDILPFQPLPNLLATTAAWAVPGSLSWTIPRNHFDRYKGI